MNVGDDVDDGGDASIRPVVEPVHQHAEIEGKEPSLVASSGRIIAIESARQLLDRHGVREAAGKYIMVEQL